MMDSVVRGGRLTRRGGSPEKDKVGILSHI